MKKVIVSFIAFCVFAPAVGQAQITQVCGDSAPPTINVPDGTADKAAAKCLSTITKSSTKFIQSKLKAMAKCQKDRVPGACPSVKDTEKIEKAAIKGAEKIAKKCDPSALSALSSSYSSGFAAADVASCMLSQNNVSAAMILAKLNGITDGFSSSGGTNPSLESCADSLNKTTSKLYPKVLKTINKCIDKEAKAGTAGDVSTICAPSYSGGAYVAPTEPKTAAKLEKAILKSTDAIDNDCNPAISSFFLPRLHACPYAATNEDLRECLVCDDQNSVWAQVNDILEQQYAEVGTLVSPGADAIQNAHDTASIGDKLLIASGTYNEDVAVTTDGVQFVGCGGATDDRPVIEPGGGSGTNRGFFAVGVDDLVFQSLTPNNWDSDGIFVTGIDDVTFSNNVTFRDIKADGQINSRYIIFPAFMDGIVVELNEAFDCDDAALYVGKSANIVVRYNETYGNVAGVEVENCDNAETHNNYTHDNTTGMVLFLDSTLLPRSNDNNHAFHNYIANNNVPNFAPSGFVQNLPQGTGVLIISPTNNSFTYNHIEGNQAIGVTLLDQAGVNVFADNVWPEADGVPGDVCTDNYIANNTGLATNGTIPDPDIGFAILNGVAWNEENRVPATGASNTGNCYENNDVAPAFILGGANDCP